MACDKLTISQVHDMMPDALIISPGPCTPSHATSSSAIVSTFSGVIPILGICLGHQIIASLFGGKVDVGHTPMHGKVSDVHHYGNALFQNVPSKFQCMRYHSLSVDMYNANLIQVIAMSEDDVVMGIKHNTHDTYGLQFHPESILSTYGDLILKNFINLCYSKSQY